MMLRAWLVVPLLLLGGCGDRAGVTSADDDGGGDAPPSTGPGIGQYVAADLPPPYAAGDELRLTIRPGELSAQATCNTFSGRADWSGGVLDLRNLAGTEMGCPGDGHAQDEWLVDFLTSSPAVELVEGGVVLTGEDDAIKLVATLELPPGPE